MKQLITTILGIGAIALVISTTTIQGQAEEKKAKSEASKANPRTVMPFHAKVVSVDKAARTIDLGKRKFHFTIQTQVSRDGKPASMDDAKIGEIASGSYKTVGDKLELQKIRFGPKPVPEAAGNVAKTDKK